MIKLVMAVLISAAAVVAQPAPPGVRTGSEFPTTGTCSGESQVGNIYVRSQNPANAPIGVFRCSQTGDPSRLGSGAYTWQPIGHLALATLPATCTVGDLAFLTAATAGQNIYGCTSTNVWTLQSGGSTPTLTWTGMSNPQYLALTNVQYIALGN